MYRRPQVRTAPPTPTPSPLTKPPLSRQASNAAAAQTDRVGAGTDPIGRLEEELGQLGDASGQVGEALQVGKQQEARRQSLARLRGCSGAAAELWGWRTLEGELGGLYGACCHIIALPNLNHSQTRLGRGLGQRDS